MAIFKLVIILNIVSPQFPTVMFKHEIIRLWSENNKAYTNYGNPQYADRIRQNVTNIHSYYLIESLLTILTYSQNGSFSPLKPPHFST